MCSLLVVFFCFIDVQGCFPKTLITCKSTSYFRWQSVVGVNSNVFGLESIIYPNGLTNYPVTQLRSDLMSGKLV